MRVGQRSSFSPSSKFRRLHSPDSKSSAMKFKRLRRWEVIINEIRLVKLGIVWNRRLTNVLRLRRGALFCFDRFPCLLGAFQVLAVCLWISTGCECSRKSCQVRSPMVEPGDRAKVFESNSKRLDSRLTMFIKSRFRSERGLKGVGRRVF